MPKAHDREAKKLDKRALVIAYLSYALEDVRVLNDFSMHLLQMTIESLRDEAIGQETGWSLSQH